MAEEAPVVHANGPVGLAEAIRQVREQLNIAQNEGRGKDLQFRLGEVQLQFQVEFIREGGGDAGVKLWVVTAGAKGSVTSSRTHTLTVTMAPQRMNDDGSVEELLVGDDVTARPPLPETSAAR